MTIQDFLDSLKGKEKKKARFTEPLLVKFTKEQMDWIRNYAQENCTSINSVVRMCINKRINQPKE